MALIWKERRKPDLDGAKFSTQRCVTYIVLLIFFIVVWQVLLGPNQDQSERSMILQTVINVTLLALGFWLGSSKSGQELSALKAAPQPDVSVQVETANVTTGEKK